MNLTQRLHDRKRYSRASHPPVADQQHRHDQIVDQRPWPRTRRPARPPGSSRGAGGSQHRRRSADNAVDYALLLLRTPRLFVEAKGIGENIEDPKWTNQTISYAAVAGFEWVALTDGAQWRIYNAHAPVPAEEKLFRSVDIADDPDGAVEILELLSKDNMRENRIQELWQSYFVDRQIHMVLTELFTGTEPPADLVNLVAKRTERLSRQVVRASPATGAGDVRLPATDAVGRRRAVRRHPRRPGAARPGCW
jgi:hypothetical protein